MCWDAVIKCVNDSGATSLGNPTIQRNSFAAFVSTTADPKVNSAQEMQNVPEGALIGFVEDKGPGKGDALVHAMISTGQGYAAGTKNACMGIGSAIGWENLDLAPLKWVSGGFNLGTKQLIRVYYRAI